MGTQFLMIMTFGLMQDPMCMGLSTYYKAFDFLDQATAQWNYALVRNWYASHVANSYYLKEGNS